MTLYALLPKSSPNASRDSRCTSRCCGPSNNLSRLSASVGDSISFERYRVSNRCASAIKLSWTRTAASSSALSVAHFRCLRLRLRSLSWHNRVRSLEFHPGLGSRRAPCRQAFSLAGHQGGLIAPQPTQLPASALCPSTALSARRKPPTGSQWVHEIKLDGYRMAARIDNGHAQLRSPI
jgi:hypothetical protein